MSLATSLRSHISKDRLRHFVEGICQFERPAGFPGEMANIAFMRDELEKAGITTQLYSFPAWLSMPEGASLDVLAPEAFSVPCKTRAFSPTTPEGGLEGALMYVEKAAESGKASSIFDYRTREDLEAFAGIDVTGKIVLSRSGGPDGYYAAQTAGAMAQIALWPSDEDAIHELTVNGVWGTATPESASRLPRMTSISVKNKDGERLVALCEKGPVQVRIHAKAHTRWETIHLLTAQVDAPTDSSLFTMVGGHHCSWHIGCTDNATGNACLMELAIILQEHREALKHHVRFCWWPGHSQGRYAGSTWYIDNYFEDLSPNCIGYLNIDSPGVKGATEYEARYVTAEVERAVLSAIQTVSGQEAPVKRPYRAGDQSFLNAGLSSMGAYSMLPATSPDRALVGGCAGAWWWHTEADTIDKWSEEILVRDAEIYLEILAPLSTSEVLPFDMAEVGHHVGQRVDDIVRGDKTGFDVAPVKAAVETFVRSALALSEMASMVTDHETQTQVNHTMLGACRLVNSVLYSVAGNYEQDPALQKPVLPGLSQLAALQDLDPASSDYHFLHTYLVRERNRLVDALNRASRSLEDTATLVKQS
jgi:N-acetylated-alpha-linked acidic dipeptidase